MPMPCHRSLYLQSALRSGLKLEELLIHWDLQAGALDSKAGSSDSTTRPAGFEPATDARKNLSDLPGKLSSSCELRLREPSTSS